MRCFLYSLQTTLASCWLRGGGGVGLPDRVGLVWSGLTGKGG